MFEILPLSGFELRISGVGSDRSANCATTTAHSLFLIVLRFYSFIVIINHYGAI